MHKILLAASVALTLSMSVVAGDDVVTEDVPVPAPVVRTGTCGQLNAADDCKSVGINIETGEIVMSTEVGGRDVWSEGNFEVVGQLATHAEHQRLDGLARSNQSATFINSNRINLNAKSIDFNKISISNLQNDISRLDGQVAAQVAASSSVTPINWNGDLALTIGVGTYRGNVGAAFALMTAKGDWTAKLTVTGSDADSWSSLAVGAGLGVVF